LLINGYGPTESTVSLQARIDPHAPAERRSLPIGHPVERTEALLLSHEGRPGQVLGELALRSAHVALGYWRNQEQSCAAFLHDPDGGPQRIYRTGDLGRLLPDGTLEFRGRKDLQAKLHGVRFEPGEVEQHLRQHPGVRDAAAGVCEAEGGARAVVWWTARGLPAPSSHALWAFLQQRLPPALLPSLFVRLDTLPLTASGKIDRRALPAPELPRSSAPVLPRDDLERALATIWRSVLGVEQLGIHDDFFALGGHSLLALRVMAEVERSTGTRLPLSALLEAPTVEQLAAAVQAQRTTTSSRALVAIQPAGTRPPLFCVHGHSGEVLFYRDLAGHLGRGQPFFGLQAQGPAGEAARHGLPAMAGAYLAEVRAVQPRGPYYLGGYCLGALVAFEMAQQLVAQGEEVALLALFWGPARRAPLVDRLRVQLALLQQLGPRAGSAGLLARARQRLAPGRALFDPSGQNLEAARAYRPKPYPGRATLFYCGGSERAARLEVQRDLAGMNAAQLDLVPVAGDRDSMLREPFVRLLASRLRAVLAGLRGEAGEGAQAAQD
jgi:thioesterase domain-containing protein/acyl carrier protein